MESPVGHPGELDFGLLHALKILILGRIPRSWETPRIWAESGARLLEIVPFPEPSDPPPDSFLVCSEALDAVDDCEGRLHRADLYRQ